jgi:hypothetical protein
VPLSHACDLGEHQNCGGNGDVLGCTCRCHDACDCERCGADLGDGQSGLCVFCYAERAAEAEARPPLLSCEYCARDGGVCPVCDPAKRGV